MSKEITYQTMINHKLEELPEELRLPILAVAGEVADGYGLSEVYIYVQDFVDALKLPVEKFRVRTVEACQANPQGLCKKCGDYMDNCICDDVLEYYNQ